MAATKDEQQQTEEMQNIRGQNKGTGSRLRLLKHLLHFSTVQPSKPSEGAVSPGASANNSGRCELWGHYEKVFFVRNNWHLS